MLWCTVNLEFAGYAMKEFRERRNVGPLPDGRGSDKIPLETRRSTCDRALGLYRRSTARAEARGSLLLQ